MVQYVGHPPVLRCHKLFWLVKKIRPKDPRKKKNRLHFYNWLSRGRTNGTERAGGGRGVETGCSRRRKKKRTKPQRGANPLGPLRGESGERMMFQRSDMSLNEQKVENGFFGEKGATLANQVPRGSNGVQVSGFTKICLKGLLDTIHR